MEAITLSLAHCYYFRLQDNDEMRKLGVSRTDFRAMVEEAVGQTPDRTWRYHTENAFEENIQEKMDWIVEAMTPLPPGIAPNVALRENMFMMIVCVLNHCVCSARLAFCSIIGVLHRAFLEIKHKIKQD